MIRGLKPYPTYKDSGVPWLRKVPEHWDIKRNKFLLREVNERSEDGSEELLTVSQYTGVSRRRVRLTGGNVLLTNAASLVGYKRVMPGDLVINIMLAWNRSLGVSSFAGIVSPSYSVFRTKTNSVEPLFLHYLFRSPLFIGAFKTVSTGVVDSRLRLYPDVFLRLPSIVPPFSEQIAIVRFLGWVEQRIRRLIRARKKRTKLLEEYKQALIHQAVTGQIDVRTGQPYPVYKCSGVEWFCEVPKHWEVCRLKAMLIKNDSGVWHNRHDPNGTIVLRSTEQTISGGWRIENPAWLDLSRIERETYMLRVGDLVITKSSGSPDHIGKTSLVTGEIAALGCAFSNFLQRLRLDKNSNPKFVWYYLNSILGREQLVFHSTTTTGLGNLNAKIIGNCVIAFPNLLEQNVIVEYLDNQTAKIDAAIDATHKEIELLREYRMRLISDVVTGKVDVREVAAQLPEEPAEEDEMIGDEIVEYEAEGGEADNETVETFFEEEVEP